MIHGMLWLTYGLDSTTDVMPMWGEQSSGQWRRNSERGGRREWYAWKSLIENGKMGKWEKDSTSNDTMNAAPFSFSPFPVFLQDKQESSHYAEMNAAVDLFIAERRYLPRGVLLRTSMTYLMQHIAAHRSAASHTTVVKPREKGRKAPPKLKGNKKKKSRVDLLVVVRCNSPALAMQ